MAELYWRPDARGLAALDARGGVTVWRIGPTTGRVSRLPAQSSAPVRGAADFPPTHRAIAPGALEPAPSAIRKQPAYTGRTESRASDRATSSWLGCMRRAFPKSSRGAERRGNPVDATTLSRMCHVPGARLPRCARDDQIYFGNALLHAALLLTTAGGPATFFRLMITGADQTPVRSCGAAGHRRWQAALHPKFGCARKSRLWRFRTLTLSTQWLDVGLAALVGGRLGCVDPPTA